jgi:ATP-dependent Lon protease
MATALVSQLTNRPVRSRVAMTGEITLAGRVLPVGGIKEKVLAAHRLGIKEVILPHRNEKAVKEDIPENVRNDLKLHLVSTIEEVLQLALTPREFLPAQGLEVVPPPVVPQQFTN